MKLIPTIAPDKRPSAKLFRICFWITATFVFYIVGYLYFNFFVRKIARFSPELEKIIHIGMIALSLICIAYGLFVTAKTIKTAELDRNPKTREFMLEFVLIFMTPIGLWILQPRLNKIIYRRHYQQ